MLEGDNGFWRFAGAAGCDWEALTRGLGTSWATREVAYKWYPTNHSVSNPTIALLQRLVREHDLRPEEIEHIEVRRGRSAEPPPEQITSQMDAWIVPHYAIAAGVFGGGQNTLMRSRCNHGTRSGPRRAVSSSSTTSVAPALKANQVSSIAES